jgi:hypothetical protein
MCQTLVTVLDFLEEDDVGVDRLQGLAHVVNARAAANAGDAFVDVVGGDSDIHGSGTADAGLQGGQGRRSK